MAAAGDQSAIAALGTYVISIRKHSSLRAFPGSITRTGSPLAKPGHRRLPTRAPAGSAGQCQEPFLIPRRRPSTQVPRTRPRTSGPKPRPARMVARYPRIGRQEQRQKDPGLPGLSGYPDPRPVRVELGGHGGPSRTTPHLEVQTGRLRARRSFVGRLRARKSVMDGACARRSKLDGSAPGGPLLDGSAPGSP